MDMDATVNGIVRQFRDHEQPSCTAYTPSAEVMRLDNAINRGLEQPASPEAVMALILQGAAARYACCPEPSAESEPSDSLTEAGLETLPTSGFPYHHLTGYRSNSYIYGIKKRQERTNESMEATALP